MTKPIQVQVVHPSTTSSSAKAAATVATVAVTATATATAIPSPKHQSSHRSNGKKCSRKERKQEQMRRRQNSNRRLTTTSGIKLPMRVWFAVGFCIVSFVMYQAYTITATAGRKRNASKSTKKAAPVRKHGGTMSDTSSKLTQMALESLRKRNLKKGTFQVRDAETDEVVEMIVHRVAPEEWPEDSKGSDVIISTRADSTPENTLAPQPVAPTNDETSLGLNTQSTTPAQSPSSTPLLHPEIIAISETELVPSQSLPSMKAEKDDRSPLSESALTTTTTSSDDEANVDMLVQKMALLAKQSSMISINDGHTDTSNNYTTTDNSTAAATHTSARITATPGANPVVLTRISS